MDLFQTLLFNQRKSFEEAKLQSKVNDLKKEVARTKFHDPADEKVKPTVTEILETVEAKETKLSIELLKRYIESFKEVYYNYKYS